jgi:hypothetical protein
MATILQQESRALKWLRRDDHVADEDLVQIAERALADAEEAYRLDPSDANQRRVMSAWSFVRRARQGTTDQGSDE